MMSCAEERRRHPRVARRIEFYCYLDGQRMDSASLDISPSGVLLRTEEPIRIGAILMATPKEEAANDFPVMLIGKVVRKQAEGTPGIALQWLRCVTRRGLQALYRFIASYPEFAALTLPIPDAELTEMPVVGYDFVENRFYAPRIPGLTPPRSRRPRAGAAEVLPELEPSMGGAELEPPAAARLSHSGADAGDIVVLQVRTAGTALPPSRGIEAGFSKSSEDGALTQALRVQQEQVPVDIGVRLVLGEQSCGGRVRMISLSTLYLVPERPLESGGQARVLLPVPMAEDTATVELQCVVESTGTHRQVGEPGAHLSVSSVAAESRPGIFGRYVKYLYYRMVTEEER